MSGYEIPKKLYDQLVEDFDKYAYIKYHYELDLKTYKWKYLGSEKIARCQNDLE